MKMKLVLVFLVLITIDGYAQPQKGDLLLGGSLHFNLSSTQNYSAMNTGISPSLGVMVNDSWLIGGTALYNFGSSTMEFGTLPPTKVTTHSVGVGVFARKFIPINGKLFFHINGSISSSFDLAKTVTMTIPTTSSNVSLSANFSPGLTYFLNEKWSVFANVGLLNYTVGGLTSQVFHDVNLSLNANAFSIGVQYFIRKGVK